MRGHLQIRRNGACLGSCNLRVGEALHRRLAIQAAEQKLSINQLIVRRLNSAS